ncbi:MAG: hypothetical protein GY778_01965, partial [bacterium]|nr:hypothetical protein [bacterium]
MKQRRTFRKLSATLFTATSVMAACLGLTCPPGDPTAPLDPGVAPGNRAPRLQITDVETPTGDNNAEQGDVITISFAGEDNEDTATVRIFASTVPNPTPAEELPILGSFAIGPGSAAGLVQWETATVSPDSYSIFGEIDDGTFDAGAGTGNPPVRVTFTTEIVVAPQGTAPLPTPPALGFV